MIRLQEIKKTYDTGKVKVEALRGVSFEVQEGDFVAIMGASGSGKSTLLNILGLLDVPSAGEYYLDDITVSGLQKHQFARMRNQKIGFVFQGFDLLPRLTAFENVELPMIYAGISRAQRKATVKSVLERLGLGDRLHHYPNELSGGQNQRVAIARALANHPAMILADEPTGALDSKTSLEIMDIFQGLHQEGVTIVLVTHEPLISEHAGRILHMRDGLLYKDQRVECPRQACSLIDAMNKEVNHNESSGSGDYGLEKPAGA